MENNNSENSNFERLASDLSKTERKEFLNKISSETVNAVAAEQKSEAEKREEKKTQKENLIAKLHSEPFYRRFFLWLKSIFLNQNVEDLYNHSMVNSLAKKLEHLYPGILDAKTKSLSQDFYNCLEELKKAQDLFRPYLISTSADKEIFYYVYGICTIPDLCDDLKTTCDVYQFPLNNSLSPDMKKFLTEKMDDFLAQLPSSARTKLDEGFRSYEWIKNFVHLPIGEMMVRFVAHSCTFTQARPDFDQFLKVMGTQVTFSDDVFASIFISSQRLKNLWTMDETAFMGEKIDEFKEQAASEISCVGVFTGKIPVKKIGKVVFENLLYAPEVLAVGDNWFQKFRTQWHQLLDLRWKEWNNDYKKQNLKGRVKFYFELEDLPRFPARPWELLADEFPFKYDLSLGFVNHYLKNEYPKYSEILEKASIEGDFAIKENRVEFSDLLNSFSRLTEKIESFAGLASGDGDFGLETERFLESSRGKTDYDRAQKMVSKMTDAAAEIVNTFENNTKSFENLSFAMIGEKNSVYYGPLVNYNKIMGRDNRLFRDTMERFARNIKFAFEIISSLKDVDGFSC
jgi:hypothetical protein